MSLKTTLCKITEGMTQKFLKFNAKSTKIILNRTKSILNYFFYYNNFFKITTIILYFIKLFISHNHQK